MMVIKYKYSWSNFSQVIRKVRGRGRRRRRKRKTLKINNLMNWNFPKIIMIKIPMKTLIIRKLTKMVIKILLEKTIKMIQPQPQPLMIKKINPQKLQLLKMNLMITKILMLIIALLLMSKIMNLMRIQSTFPKR